MNENFIMISKKWLVDEVGVTNSNLLYKYGEMGLCFYTYCRLHEQAFDGGSKICIGEFLDMFGFTHRDTRKSKKEELLTTIKLMQENGLITFYSDFALSEVVSFDEDVEDTNLLYCTVDRFPEYKYFIKLDKLEILTIVSAKRNKLSFLIHYIAVMCFENHNTNVCFPSLEVLAMRAQTSVSTVERHNKALRELGVLYYANAGKRYFASENRHQAFNNTYGRWVNKDKVDAEVAKLRANEKDSIVTNTTKAKQERSNESRRLIGRVNHLNRKDKETGLSREEIVERDTKQQEYDKLRVIIDADSGKGYEHLHPKSKGTKQVVKVDTEIIVDENTFVDVIVDEPTPEPVEEPEPTQDTPQDTFDDEFDYEFMKDMGLLDDDTVEDTEVNAVVVTDEEAEIKASMKALTTITEITQAKKMKASYEGVSSDFLAGLVELDDDMDIKAMFG